MDRSQNDDTNDLNVSNDPNEPSLDDHQEDFDIASTNLTNHEPQMMLDDQRDEEIAAEITPDQSNVQQVNTDADSDLGVKANSVVGWIALALSVASFFMLPVILAGSGIVLGFIARNRDAEWIGNTAIVAGIISIIITLFILPFV